MSSDYYRELRKRFDEGLLASISGLKPEDSQTFFKLQTARHALDDLETNIKADIRAGEAANKKLIGEDKPKRRT